MFDVIIHDDRNYDKYRENPRISEKEAAAYDMKNVLSDAGSVFRDTGAMVRDVRGVAKYMGRVLSFNYKPKQGTEEQRAFRERVRQDLIDNRVIAE